MRFVSRHAGTVTVFARRRPRPTQVFDTYWRFAAERQRIFHARAAGLPAPWTSDAILRAHRFTNSYRASDRVSQFLINEVIPGSVGDPIDVAFRTLLFKTFNRVSTWKLLESELGALHASNFEPTEAAAVLSRARLEGRQIYSAAYIMPMPSMLGAVEKHEAHLALLVSLVADGTLDRVVEATDLRTVYAVLAGVPSFGPFLAFQFAIDINYSPFSTHSEMEFVVAGPGARSGVSKCFSDLDGMSYEDVIRHTCECADREFADRELDFVDLWGRPPHLIDCQNLFCEVDKYARVAHPEIGGSGGRTRIKQRYLSSSEPLSYGFPAKWAINVPEGIRWDDTARTRLAAPV
jgi:hypothetical protein